MVFEGAIVVKFLGTKMVRVVKAGAALQDGGKFVPIEKNARRKN